MLGAMKRIGVEPGYEQDGQEDKAEMPCVNGPDKGVDSIVFKG